MNSLFKIGLTVILALTISACGSNGSGSGTTPTPVPQPNPRSQVPIAEETFCQALTGCPQPGYNASTGQYFYRAYDGTIYDLSPTPNVPDGIATIYEPGGATLAVGNTTYAYSRYGSFLTTHDKDVFYTGSVTAASAVPTTGTAVYTGGAMLGMYTNRGVANAHMRYEVDFSKNTIIASSESFSAYVPMVLSLNGKLSSNGFSGNATLDSATGTFTGHFFGPAAEELGGKATFSSRPDLNASFGGKK